MFFDRPLLVLLNFGEAQNISVPAERLRRLGPGRLRDLLSGVVF